MTDTCPDTLKESTVTGRLSPMGLILTAAVLAAPVMAAPDIKYYFDPQKSLPFSPAVRAGDTVYLSGQTGIDAQGKLPTDMAAQARATMTNVATAARRAGVTMDDVVKCTVMLRDVDQLGAFNAIYIQFFKKDRRPARSAIGANGLAMGALVEVDCIAAAPAAPKRAMQ